MTAVPGAEARSRPVLLTAYDAKRCARRVHNEWDQTIPTARWDPPAELQARFDAGKEHEQRIFAALRAALGERCVDLTDARGSAARVALTQGAMATGAEVILGGQLPDDLAGSRTGRPDLLVRVTAAGDARYAPGEVKGHLMTRSSGGVVRRSSLDAPTVIEEVQGLGLRYGDRFADLLQLAHYRRMLEACGRAADEAVGFVIGTDTDGGEPFLTWCDLDDPRFQTFSRTTGTTVRSALERYDHEHGFRVQVAAVAAARTGAETDPSPLVTPVFVDECDSCPWYDYCRDITDPQVASAHITSGRLAVREWRALDVLGYGTVETLAALDVHDPDFQAAYLPEVTDQGKAVERLVDAVRRAGMVLDGRLLERETTGPVPVPRADVEVDFDIEWDADTRVYLWGAYVTGHGSQDGYHATVSWEPLDEHSESRLAQQFADWLRGLVQECRADARSIAVYHYTTAERTHLKRTLGAETVMDLLGLMVDLYPLVKRHYFGRDGLGIKKVAPAFGFTWRDEDPGGLQSQLWVAASRTSDEAVAQHARARLLTYNEDDVRATLAVREGMTAADS